MSRKILGVLTPSSNTILEPATSQMVSAVDGVSAHFSRFRVTQIALSAQANTQFQFAPMIEAATLLADAKADIIAWSGTSASWLGRGWDRSLCHALEEATGVPACTAVGAIDALLARQSIKRIGLVTPYTKDVQHQIIANYADQSIEVVAQEHTGLSDNFAFAEIEDATVVSMCRAVARARPEAIVIMCTNMRGWSLMADLEQELGIPIMDSTAAVVWQCLSTLGVEMNALAGHGRMFRSLV